MYRFIQNTQVAVARTELRVGTRAVSMLIGTPPCSAARRGALRAVGQVDEQVLQGHRSQLETGLRGARGVVRPGPDEGRLGGAAELLARDDLPVRRRTRRRPRPAP